MKSRPKKTQTKPRSRSSGVSYNNEPLKFYLSACDGVAVVKVHVGPLVIPQVLEYVPLAGQGGSEVAAFNLIYGVITVKSAEAPPC